MERDNTTLVVAVFLAIVIIGWAWSTSSQRAVQQVAPVQAVITGDSIVSCPGYQDTTLDDCSERLINK